MPHNVDFLVAVTSLPADLAAVLNSPDDPLYTAAQLYNGLVESPLLWRIWAIDVDHQLWVEVNFLDKEGEAEYHTLKLDEGTFTRLEYDPYPVLDV